MNSKTGNILYDSRVLLAIYLLVALGASIQQLVFIPPHRDAGYLYHDYNNYIIFRQAYSHLISGQDLYILYLNEHWDLFKYSPAFALGMGPLAHMPVAPGLTLWNMINAGILLWGVLLLPLAPPVRARIAWFVLPEMLTCIQSTQSNALLAGLLLIAFACMERDKLLWATLCIVLTVFLKVYGAVGFALLLFYPGKVKSVLYSCLWVLLLAAVPLLVCSPQALMMQYYSWAAMMAADHTASYGISVMGIAHSWLGADRAKTGIMVSGVVLFALPFIRLRMYSNAGYRMLALAHVLLWVIIFNHKAESPSYVIAVAGAAIWYFIAPATKWRTALMIGLFILTCLSPSDIFPAHIRNSFLVPYCIKALPCILLWVLLLGQLLLQKVNTTHPELPMTNK